MKSVIYRNKYEPVFMRKIDYKCYILLYIKPTPFITGARWALMLLNHVKMAHVRNRINRLVKYKQLLNKYSNYLDLNRYSYGTARHYRCAIEHFIYWHENNNPRRKINENLVEEFLSNHIPICKCPIPAPKRIIDLRPALKILTQMACNGNTKDKNQYSKIDKNVKDFDSYLLNVCGLCESTRIYHRRHLKMFLNAMFKNGSVKLEKLNPYNIRNFIYKHLSHYKRRSLGLFVYSLRSYFKYLQFKGYKSNALISALPNILVWKAAPLPEYLNKEEIKELLSTFDRKTSLGKRDYAMVICILEIGLRSCELANLKLEDVNWHTQTLELKRGKTRQNYILPMTSVMTNALISYLKHGRPKTSSRNIFVYHRAPKGKGIKPKVVTGVVNRAILRTELKPLRPGPHLLRKTFATKLLHNGATIKEIADLLRHKSISTTSIYTKVDFLKLSKVALPWPEEFK